MMIVMMVMVAVVVAVVLWIVPQRNGSGNDCTEGDAAAAPAVVV